ncbi:NAD-dependent epimerase [Priestia koreensis]|nr:NAD-dependent epimerase [Priestia koreensis]
MRLKIIVTGAAGFIGFHVSKRLLKEGHEVIGIDSVNDYYDPSLKKDRLKMLNQDGFTFIKCSLEDKEGIFRIFNHHKPQIVINLAAQAGVRYSIENPDVYVQSNIVGFLNILEACRSYKIDHLIYASSSSVYGANKTLPFSVSDNVDHPISLYAATKKSNELLAHTYSHLYQIPTTGMRFFTVYGPWGRPDMALFLFTKSILNEQEIEVYNHGQMRRDFTYVDDVVESIHRLLLAPPKPNNEWDATSPHAGSSYAPYQVFNIGNHSPVSLLDFIEEIEKQLGKKAKKKFLPLQPGDVPETYADIEALKNVINYVPKTSVQEGVGHFVKWYLNYYTKREEDKE